MKERSKERILKRQLERKEKKEVHERLRTLIPKRSFTPKHSGFEISTVNFHQDGNSLDNLSHKSTASFTHTPSPSQSPQMDPFQISSRMSQNSYDDRRRSSKSSESSTPPIGHIRSASFSCDKHFFSSIPVTRYRSEVISPRAGFSEDVNIMFLFSHLFLFFCYIYFRRKNPKEKIIELDLIREESKKNRLEYEKEKKEKKELAEVIEF
jgi:hypothetical protein